MELATLEPTQRDEEVFTFFDVDPDIDPSGAETAPGSSEPATGETQGKAEKRKIRKRNRAEETDSSQSDSPQPENALPETARDETAQLGSWQPENPEHQTIDGGLDPAAEPIEAELPGPAAGTEQPPADRGSDLAAGDGLSSTPAVERLARIKEQAKRDLEPEGDNHETPDQPGTELPISQSADSGAAATGSPATDSPVDAPQVTAPSATHSPDRRPARSRERTNQPQSSEDAAKAAARRQRRTTSSASRAAMPDRRRSSSEQGPAKPPTAPMIGEVRTIGGRRRTDNIEPEPTQIEGAPLDSESANSVIEALNAIDQFDSDQSGQEAGGGDGGGPTKLRKADTDTNGNWVPPVLRGMASDARDAGADLPKRRRPE